MIEGSGHKPLALVPNEAYLSYQLYAYSPVSNQSEADTKLLTAIKQTFLWLQSRFRNISEMPEEIQFSDKTDLKSLFTFRIDKGYTLDACYIHEERVWALQLLEPDMGPNPGSPDNREPIPGRMFQTNIAYRITGNKLECGFKTYCIQPINCEEKDWEVFRLKIVKMLISTIGIEQIVPIVISPYMNTAIGNIVKLINNKKRQMPIILITEPGNIPIAKPPIHVSDAVLSKIDISHSATPMGVTFRTKLPHLEDNVIEHTKNVVDIDEISAGTVGFAHTYYVKTEDIEKISKEINHKLSPCGGELAVIMPKNKHYYNNWHYTKEEIFTYKKSRDEAGSFEKEFIIRLSKFPKNNYFINYGKVLFLNDARAFEQRFLSKSRNLTDQYSSLKEELSIKEKKISELEQSNNAMCSTIEDLLNTNQKFENRISKLMEEKIYLQKEHTNYYYSSEQNVSDLKKDLMFYKSLPEKIEGIASWIENNYADTIVLTKKAKQSLNTGKFKNIPLLCGAIRCLSENYQKNQMKSLQDNLEELGLEYAHDSSKSTKKNYDAYFPEYPEGSGKRIELKMHIRNKPNKNYDKSDPAGTLRIYFTYDKSFNKIVIHHLPEHLPTVTKRNIVKKRR